MNPGDAAIVRLYDTIRMEMINHYIISADDSVAHFEHIVLAFLWCFSGVLSIS